MTSEPGPSKEVSIEIRATPEALWDLMNDEERIFELRPGLVEHRIVEVHGDGSHDCVQVYARDGRRFSQESRAVRYERPSRKVDEATTDDGQRVSITTNFAPIEGGTLLAMRVVVLEPRVGRLQSRWLLSEWTSALRFSLKHIKTVAEGP